MPFGFLCVRLHVRRVVIRKTVTENVAVYQPLKRRIQISPCECGLKNVKKNQFTRGEI